MGRRYEVRRRQRQPAEAHLYELNLWMWRYGRGQERKVSVLQRLQACWMAEAAAAPSIADTKPV